MHTTFTRRRKSNAYKKKHRPKAFVPRFDLLEDRRMLSVQDISSFPSEFVKLGSDVLFAAQDQGGHELWKHDGVSASRVVDLNANGSSYPDELTVIGSSLYFTARDDVQGIKLWQYDGVSVTQVTDIFGSGPTDVFDLIDVGGQLYFLAEDTTNRREVWTSDGTPGGTFMLQDIFPDDDDLGEPAELTDVNGTLFFTAYDEQHGWELWTSDGTTVGTEMVADINANGEDGSTPTDLVAVGNTLFFQADDGVNGRELWKKEPASAPELVKDITAGISDSELADFVASGSHLYFTTWDDVAGTTELWKSDGTAGGTQSITSLRPTEAWDVAMIADVSGTLMFTLFAPQEQDGWELWKSDGTPGGTQLLRAFPEWGHWIDPWSLTPVGSSLFFTSYDSNFGHELWKSNGTPGGTTRVADINPQIGHSSPSFLTNVDGTLYFGADDGNTGIEPYTSDGTALGTTLLQNIELAQMATPEILISLSFDSDTGYADDDRITNVTCPAFVVNVNMPGLVEIDFNDDGFFEFSQMVDNWGSYEFHATNFADGQHTIRARFTASGLPTVEDATSITVDTTRPRLTGGFPVEGSTSDFHTIFFDEPINEDYLFNDYFMLDGPAITESISLTDFYADLSTDEISLGFNPLVTPGEYTITISPNIEDMAGNLLDDNSPTTTTFTVVPDPVFLTDDSQTYTWDPIYEGKDLVLDGVIMEVSGVHGLSSLWLLNGARITTLAEQPLDFQVVNQVVIDAVSEILGGRGFPGGADGMAGMGPGGGGPGTDGGGGGGHGGAGGPGGTLLNGAPGITNGSTGMPVEMGSGGGGSATEMGGEGGGAIKLTAGATVNIEGSIDAGGFSGQSGGGGAGGSIWIVADTLSGNGSLTATGGSTVGFGGGGGGGRIAVDLASNLFTGQVAVDGGSSFSGASRNGMDGTIDANPSFPTGEGSANRLADGDGPAQEMHKKGKKKAIKSKTKINYEAYQSNRKTDKQKRKARIEKTIKRNQVTLKGLKPGNYQANYKQRVTKQTKNTSSDRNGGRGNFSPPAPFSPFRRSVAEGGCLSSVDNFGFGVRSEHAFSQIVSWDGGGDGFSWNDPMNWETDGVPSSNMVVFVPAAPNRGVTIDADAEVRAILADANLFIDGNLTIADLSVANADFELLAGAQLTATGLGARFFGNGDTVIHGANLSASQSAQIVLPSVMHYDYSTPSGSATRVLRASTGGVLSLPNLQTIVNGQTSNTDILIEATSGGQIDLGNVTQITDPAIGGFSGTAVDVVANGVGSVVDLSSLVSFSDKNNNEFSTMAASGGGEIMLSTNPAEDLMFSAVNIILDGTGTLPVDRITSLHDGRVDLSGSAYQFPNLTTAARTAWFISEIGTTIDLPLLADIQGASFDVRDGVTLALTFPTAYDYSTPSGSATRVLRASSGAVLSLPNLQTIVNGQTSNTDILIEATSGGQIDLGNVLQITDPAIGGFSGTAVDVVANGVGSVVDLSSLVSFADKNNNELSTMAASGNGEIMLPTNPADDLMFTAVNIILDGTGTLPVDRITSLQDGRVDLSGSAYQFPNLTTAARTAWFISEIGTTIDLPLLADIQGASFDVRDGVTLALTLPTAYDYSTPSGSATRVFRASTGAVLSLPNLQTIVNGQTSNTDILIEATSGGQIDLGNVTQITDPAIGGFSGTAVDVVADGVGSTIDLSSLVSFADKNNNEFSTMAASGGGEIMLSTNPAEDLIFTAVNIILDGTGTLPVDRITSLHDGRVDLSGSAYQFPNLTTAARTAWFISEIGTTIDLPLLADIQGASFDVRDGVTLALTLPTAYDYSTPSGSATRVFRVSTGGVISLPNLQTIVNGQTSNTDILIEATSGGQIDLSDVTQITDPATGSTSGSAVDVVADGVNSLVDLANLENFIDRNANEASLLTSSNLGMINVDLMKLLSVNVTVTLNATARPILPAVDTEFDGVADPRHEEQPGMSDLAIAVARGMQAPGLVEWTGTSGDWNDPSNWSTGQVPGRFNDVVIDVPNAQSISVSGTHIVRSLSVEEAFELVSGVLTVTRASDIHGALTVQPGATLEVDGDFASLTAHGVTQIDGANLIVSGGGTLSLPNVMTYDYSTPSGSATRVFRASAGGVLSLPNLQTIVNGQTSNTDILIEATSGGQIDLGNVLQITDPAIGGFSGTAVDVVANGVGSVVDLSSLVSFADKNNNEFSTMTASGSGEIMLPTNPADDLIFTAVNIILDGTGTLPVDRITSLHDGRVDLSGSAYQFPNLTTAARTAWFISEIGTTIDLPLLADIQGASFDVRDGVTLALTLPTAYDYSTPSGSATRVFRASTGGVLSLPNLQTIVNGQTSNTDILIEAASGGQIDLGNVTQITDPAIGGFSGTAVDVVANGVGSVVDLSSLVSFADKNNNEFSTMTASGSGEIMLPTNPADDLIFTAVNIILDGTGTLPVDRITSLHDGRVDLSGSAYQFPNLTTAARTAWFISEIGTTIDLPLLADIQGASFDVRDGVTLALTLPTAYDYSTPSGSATRVFRASTGGVLSLPNLQTIVNGQTSNTDILIEAASGGQIDLGNVTQITDPAIGGFSGTAVDVVADGVGSTIDLSSLVSFSDKNNNEFSTMTASGSGEIMLPTNPAEDLIFTAVNIILDGTGTLPVDRITSLHDGRVDLSGSAYQFPNLTTAARTAWFISEIGTTIDLPLLADIQGASFDVRDGVTLALTLPTAYDYSTPSGSATRVFRASTGGVISLPNLQTIVNGQTSNTDILIEATSGGQIDLSDVTQITDPATGSTSGSAVDIVADGVGSVVDLSAMTDFIDLNNNDPSTITAVYRGAVKLKPGNSTTVDGGNVSTTNLGEIDGSLVLLNNSTLAGDANVTGNVTSSGNVAPHGTLQINTDYTQSSTGALEIEVFGSLPEEADSLQITGVATLDGTLDVVLVGGFEPAIGDRWDILTFASRVGEFATTSLPSLVGNQRLVVSYGPQAVALATVPTGDFDDDGGYDAADIDALIAAIVGGTDPVAFDLTGDGSVDLADRDAWLVEAGAANLPSGNAYLLGDVTLDGVVDGQDFLTWNSNKFTSTGTWSQADFNADGITDGQDFLIWNSNKFTSSDVASALIPTLRGFAHQHDQQVKSREDVTSPELELADAVFSRWDLG